MSITAGLDVGSTYTKVVLLSEDRKILGKSLNQSGFKLAEVADQTYAEALTEAGLNRSDVDYVIATSQAVRDRDAMTFVLKLHRQLARGETVEEALRLTRTELSSIANEHVANWMVYAARA